MENLSSNFWIIPLYLLSNLSFLFNLVCTPCTPLLERLMKQIYSHLNENGKCVFSMSHPISTAYDGTFDRYTRTETGERLYANLRNYGIEGKRVIHWVVDEYELYHRTISTLINDIVSAGFIIEECQESKVPESIREKRADMFGGVIHQPDFIFFRCGKKN